MQTSQERPTTTFRVADSAPPGSARRDSSAQPAQRCRTRNLWTAACCGHCYTHSAIRRFSLRSGMARTSAPRSRWRPFTFRIDPRWCAFARDPDLQFGELYSIGKIPVEGDLGRLIEVLYSRRGASRA